MSRKRKLPKPRTEAERRKRVEVVETGLEYACPLERYERKNNIGWNSMIRAIEDLGMPQPKNPSYPPPTYGLESYWTRRDGRVSDNLAQDCELCSMDGAYVWECVWRSGLLDYLKAGREVA